jgi:cysteinyl-tRNA synthetase
MTMDEKADAVRMEVFLAAMDDDLNTPNGFMEIFETVKLLNQSLRSNTPDVKRVAALYQAVREMLDVMGIAIPVVELTPDDKEDYAVWNRAKADKDFVTADRIRTKLAAQGKL